MGPKIERLTRIGHVIKEGFKQVVDRLGGRTPKAEQFALKVLTNPGNITLEEIENFKRQKVILIAKATAFRGDVGGFSALAERERLDSLSPEKLLEEMKKDAQEATEDWKLRSAA